MKLVPKIDLNIQWNIMYELEIQRSYLQQASAFAEKDKCTEICKIYSQDSRVSQSLPDGEHHQV